MAQRAGVKLTVVGDEPQPGFDSTTAIALFRIVQEALNNAMKHAKSTEIEIAFQRNEDHSILVVSDNGCGFDVRRRRVLGPQGLGLTTMRERAEAIGATLAIESKPGKGTRVEIKTSVG
jgi:two-component system NarL family sensor kinase